MNFTNFNTCSVHTCLSFCKLIEQSFELSSPDLFELYKQDRLHGHDHVWNVTENSLMIACRILQHPLQTPIEIDYKHLIAACLLHDTAGLNIDYNKRVEHHIKAEKYIRKIIDHFNSINEFKLNANRIFEIARAHRLRNAFPPNNIEEEIIALADGLDENMNRLYRGNKNIRKFYDESLSIEHRFKVVRRRNLQSEAISREDPRNDALMFMLDSLVRNSVDYNPWKLTLKDGQNNNLIIKDACYSEISESYFNSNYPLLMLYVKKENLGFLEQYIIEFLDKVSEYSEFFYLKRILTALN